VRRLIWRLSTICRHYRIVAGDNSTRTFQPVRAHWQLNNYLLSTLRCTDVRYFVTWLCLSSKT